MAKVAGNYKQMNLVSYFFLATVMLQIIWVNADHGCLHEDDTCVVNGTPACCEGLECVEVEQDVYKCEPPCEDHVGHSCGVDRECCEGLVCNSSNQCECVLKSGNSCVPGVDNCCDLDCVAVAVGVYQCA